ncbi:glycogen-binding subunit 76A [Drosophila hydei]|uniref:Glycogen-binding subunit 76A n=1 Tax=Drosophila hydei TaxID=7224 RepID=A0A6J1MGX5_DROHY|nr:glycogen-binding subunit 76A [Drosophila hydei]XP_023178369.2 glycogen-binding subunit 76A [Drosophila hydei]XP_023178370.2 glycogen-binding subunit 76A [Drosophila hydei]XP_023178371.2 glycogen-binding subunit 76A [Drosophila hydei]
MNEPGDIPLTLSSTPDNRPPCSIISIIPNIGMSSCRGRAEAFARSLSSKLRTLGSQTNEEGAANAEDEPIINGSNTNTWVNAHESEQTVTDLQPLRQESDSFFDFDCELESPGSPVDECEYLRLIETASNTPHNSTAESGYACASAASSHSSTDGPYFDAATGSSSSIGTVPQELLVTTKQPTQTERSKVPGTELNEFVNTLQLNGTHEPLTNGDEQQQQQQQKEQEQVNKELEQQQAEQAREAEDETLLQAQILSELQLHSESIKSPDNGFSEEQVDEPALVNGYIEASEEQKLDNENIAPAAEVVEEQKTPDSGTDEVDKCTESSSLTVNVELAQLEQAQQDVDEAKEKTRQSHGIDTTDDEDDCRPQRVRRCSSLKTGKTPPGTPGRKKIVRFADVLGLDLADVKTFLDEIPTIPKSAFEDLEILDTEPPLQLGPKSDKLLMPLFQQPGGLATFLDAVREKQVSLENAAVTDSINQTIAGSVRVRNLDFHKSVHVRYSLDGWRSFADLQANYVENSCDGFSDKFTFVLFGNSLHVGQRLEFAVRFQCKGQQFWDNNYGANYCFQCLPSSNHTASPASVANGAVQSHHGSNLVGLLSPTAGDAWCSSFY